MTISQNKYPCKEAGTMHEYITYSHYRLIAWLEDACVVFSDKVLKWEQIPAEKRAHLNREKQVFLLQLTASLSILLQPTGFWVFIFVHTVHCFKK